MNQPLRIGMFSFAHGHAYSYANALRTLPGVVLAGVHDEDSERGLAAARAYQTDYFRDPSGLLGVGLDGVVICSESAGHAPLAIAAAGQVKAILCEKPIATTVADAEAMISRCAVTGTRLQTAYPVRFAPPIAELKAMLDRRELGQVTSVNCTNHGSMPGGWFVDPRLAGGGSVMDHTVHVVDLLRWFWKTEVIEVYAEIGRSLLHPGLVVDDAGLLAFRLANGVYGTLDTSWSRPPSYPTWGDVKIEVVGDQGVVTVDALRQDLWASAEQWGQTRRIAWGSSMDRALIKDFVAMLRGGASPSITGTDGLRGLEVALAAYESASIGRPVAISRAAV